MTRTGPCRGAAVSPLTGCSGSLSIPQGHSEQGAGLDVGPQQNTAVRCRAALPVSRSTRGKLLLSSHPSAGASSRAGQALAHSHPPWREAPRSGPQGSWRRAARSGTWTTVDASPAETWVCAAILTLQRRLRRAAAQMWFCLFSLPLKIYHALQQVLRNIREIHSPHTCLGVADGWEGLQQDRRPGLMADTGGHTAGTEASEAQEHSPWGTHAQRRASALCLFGLL